MAPGGDFNTNLPVKVFMMFLGSVKLKSAFRFELRIFIGIILGLSKTFSESSQCIILVRSMFEAFDKEYLIGGSGRIL